MYKEKTQNDWVQTDMQMLFKTRDAARDYVKNMKQQVEGSPLKIKARVEAGSGYSCHTRRRDGNWKVSATFIPQ